METISLHLVKNMSTIYQRQNEPGMVGAQRAARCLYSKAKRLAGINYFGTLFFAVLFSVLATFIQDNKIDYWSFAVTIIVFLANFGFDYFINKTKAFAAGLQQYFDLVVFDIPESKKYLTHGIPNISKRIEVIAKYKDKNVGKIEDWYDNYSGLSKYNQVLKCQEESIRWDVELRKKYIWLLSVFCVLEVLIVISFAIHGTGLVNGFAVAVWVLPILKVALTVIVNLVKDIGRLKDLENEKAQAEAIKQDETKLFESVCDLQHFIYEHRKQCCLIPDSFYKFFHKKDQMRENKIREETLKEETQDEFDDQSEN